MLNLFGSHDLVFKMGFMIKQTILQEASGITTQKLILCAILLPSGFAQAQADEVIDFNPDQNDTIFLRRKYSEMDTNTKPYEITGESVRIDAEGDVEIQLKNSNWARIVRLNQHNLELNSREITGGLQLFFTRRF